MTIIHPPANVWRREPATPEALSLELRKRSEAWIHWDRSPGLIFLDDLKGFNIELLRSFISDMKVLHVSLDLELRDLNSALNGLGPYQEMAGQDLRIRIAKAKRKLSNISRFHREARNVQKLRNYEAFNQPKDHAKKLAKEAALAAKREVRASRHETHKLVAKQESTAKGRHFFSLLRRVLGDSTVEEFEVLCRAFAVEDLQSWATSQDINQSVLDKYVRNCSEDVDRRLSRLGCDLDSLKEKYGLRQEASE